MVAAAAAAAVMAQVVGLAGIASAEGKRPNLTALSAPRRVDSGTAGAAILAQSAGKLVDCPSDRICTVGETSLERVVLGVPRAVDTTPSFGPVTSACNGGQYRSAFRWEDAADDGRPGTAIAVLLSPGHEKVSQFVLVDCSVKNEVHLPL